MRPGGGAPELGPSLAARITGTRYGMVNEMVRKRVSALLLVAAAVLLAWSLAAPWGRASSPLVTYKFGIRGVASPDASCSWLARAPASFCATDRPSHLFGVRAAALLLAVALMTSLAGSLPGFSRKRLAFTAAALTALAVGILLWAFVDLLLVARDLTVTYHGSGRNAAIGAVVLCLVTGVVAPRRRSIRPPAT